VEKLDAFFSSTDNNMIWIITDVIAEAIYRIVYIPVIAVTAAWCLGCSLVSGIKGLIRAKSAE
jgi:hypothetical protein